MRKNNPFSRYDLLTIELANKYYGRKLDKNHHWKRLTRCQNAIIECNGDVDKAFSFLIQKDKK